jgi:hypothetical protein
VKHVEITKEVVSQTEIEFELISVKFLNSLGVFFCTPDDALVVRNILSFHIQIPSQFVKSPSDTLLRLK